MTFLQFMILVAGLQTFRVLVLGTSSTVRKIVNFKMFLEDLINFLLLNCVSYYALKYTLPILIDLFKEMI